MPVNPFTVQERDARFADQRWLLDLVIELVGPDWDQGRLEYYAAPCSADNKAAFLALRGSIKKFDDFTREFVKLARHFELRGKAQLDAGHARSAADDLFAAAIAYGAAQWPIYTNTELNQVLEQKKNDCYRAWSERADHPVKAVEVPYRGRTLPGYLHLPPGTEPGADAGLPLVVMVSGMDAFKELTLACSGDRYLGRGLAALVIDGPGQGSCLPREIWYDPTTYGEVGVGAYETAVGAPEIDPDRIMVWGLSQGSFWATQMAASEPRYAAAAVMYTCFDPRNTAMFATQSPTFGQKFMFMTGSTSFDEMQRKVETMQVGPLSAKLTMPYLVVAGEDDPLTDPQETFDHLNNVPDPKQLLFYTGEDHAPVTRGSGRLGPAHAVYVADWLADRAAGRPCESQQITVDFLGNQHVQPWGGARHYSYGAPLDAKTLLGDGPLTGTA
ncbi:MAG: alpha/beta hydrolase [Pseudonocardia sp.]|nr:alpha/beta hydrolase [Pseudonocardia sp.]